jgi:hypothetical protein
MTVNRDLLRLKLAEARSARAPTITRRDVKLPGIAGKAIAIVGIRRAGKTTYLWQCRADRIAEGRPEESQLILSLEDERLAGMSVADLAWLLEEHERQSPDLRAAGGLTLYLDEIQVVPGWEGLVRRLIDRGDTEVFVTGSSARLLSREVATSLRGRAMETLVLPFSFCEALRHAGHEPDVDWERLAPGERARLDSRLREYLVVGGFPEAQRATTRDRNALLAGYVDVVVLRDVIERHGVASPVALRWLQRELLSTPGGRFAVNRLHSVMRSQGISVSKDTLHTYLAYLVDAFLIRTISLDTGSERRRMVNPRKAYPADPGLISLFERSGREHRGRALETAVYLELERRGWRVTYVRTSDDWEVDFLAERAGDRPLLLQVCLESEGDLAWERELRALERAASAYPRAHPYLITLDASPPSRPLPGAIAWVPAARWLLEGS